VLTPARRALGAAGPATYRVDGATARRDHVGVLPRATRDATFRFAPETSEGDRGAFLSAVAHARPPARRLIDLVDGLVEVNVARTSVASALGVTEPGTKGYRVTVDFATIAPRYGQRGIDRVVLHELGHVVDFALVPEDVRAVLLDGIPLGYGCEEGRTGACATDRERFAEGFAKWATGDIGGDLYIGYQVLPPGPTLDAWGLPLERLGR
jgi:hypothetical protein